MWPTIRSAVDEKTAKGMRGWTNDQKIDELSTDRLKCNLSARGREWHFRVEHLMFCNACVNFVPVSADVSAVEGFLGAYVFVCVSVSAR